MKLKAKSIKTPIGYFPAPLNPNFKTDLKHCESNEDLFKLASKNGFISPDAINEINARYLYSEYLKWGKK